MTNISGTPFWEFLQKYFNGGSVEQWMVISEFLDDVKSTSDEKKAPPYMERLQKEHCTKRAITSGIMCWNRIDASWNKLVEPVLNNLFSTIFQTLCLYVFTNIWTMFTSRSEITRKVFSTIFQTLCFHQYLITIFNQLGLSVVAFVTKPLNFQPPQKVMQQFFFGLLRTLFWSN